MNDLVDQSPLDHKPHMKIMEKFTSSRLMCFHAASTLFSFWTRSQSVQLIWWIAARGEYVRSFLVSNHRSLVTADELQIKISPLAPLAIFRQTVKFSWRSYEYWWMPKTSGSPCARLFVQAERKHEFNPTLERTLNSITSHISNSWEPRLFVFS